MKSGDRYVWRSGDENFPNRHYCYECEIIDNNCILVIQGLDKGKTYKIEFWGIGGDLWKYIGNYKKSEKFKSLWDRLR